MPTESDRDALARIIHDALIGESDPRYWSASRQASDAVLAAGYRRPDALRERVMAAMDAAYWFRSKNGIIQPPLLDDFKDAVVAALKETA